jgi:cytochrome c
MGFIFKSTVFIFPLLIFAWTSQVLADSQGHLPGIQSKTIEELIEMTEPDGGAAREKAKLLQRGKITYRQFCVHCHGEEGEQEGSLAQELNDAWGNPSKVYDLRRTELYKGGASFDELFQTLVTGMDGTPMNAYDYVSGGELWHLVHFLQSRYKQEASGLVKMSETILSLRVSESLDTSSRGCCLEKGSHNPSEIESLEIP